jgi:DNA-binding response OmpR family regulator
VKTILYIEDDLEIGEWVKKDLERRSYAVIWLTRGEGAAEKVKQADLVVLDVMLPGLDDFSVGQRLKREAPQVPILMLSALGAVEDKLQGLSFADDYMTKPFHPDELAARLEVLLRRAGGSFGQEVVLGHITVRLDHQTVIDNRTREDIPLTAKQLQILHYFLKHANQILTKEQMVLSPSSRHSKKTSCYHEGWRDHLEGIFFGKKGTNIQYVHRRIQIKGGLCVCKGFIKLQGSS